MKIKDGFILREVAGTFVVISTGAESLDFKGVITINEVGSVIWRGIEEGKTIDEIVNHITDEYDVGRSVAFDDCNEFIAQLKSKSIIVD